MVKVITKAKVKEQIIDFILLTFSALSYAIAFHSFIVSNFLVPGGITGVATIIQYSTGFAAKWSNYLLNIPLMVLAIIFLHKDFAIKTIYCTTMITAWLWVLEVVQMPAFGGDVLLAVFVGGILSGISTYLGFEARGSGGGTEILAQLAYHKHPDLDMAKMLVSMNVVIMSVGGFFTGSGKFELWTVVYSVLYSFIGSVTLSILERGVDQAVRFNIITKNPDVISQKISDLLKRGVSQITIVDENGNEKPDYKMLLVVVQFRQVYAVKHVIAKYDKECFAFSSSVDGVISRPDFNKRYMK